MTMFPDQPLLISPPSKPKLTAEEHRARQTDQLMRIRFRVMITTPAGIGEATKLLTRHQWREGDLLLLEAAAAWLGVQVPEMGLQRL